MGGINVSLARPRPFFPSPAQLPRPSRPNPAPPAPPSSPSRARHTRAACRPRRRRLPSPHLAPAGLPALRARPSKLARVPKPPPPLGHERRPEPPSCAAPLPTPLCTRPPSLPASGQLRRALVALCRQRVAAAPPPPVAAPYQAPPSSSRLPPPSRWPSSATVALPRRSPIKILPSASARRTASRSAILASSTHQRLTSPCFLSPASATAYSLFPLPPPGRLSRPQPELKP